VLVDLEQRRGLLGQAGLQGDLEELLHCPVHVVTTCGLRYARTSSREQIEREARRL
jgi:predicted nucleotidyltransferase